MIVTLCGSARFEDHFKTWNEALTMAGHTVFSLTRYASEKGKKEWYSEAEKIALDAAHKRKINASEAVLVLNVFGYMGPSTLSEVEHAKTRGKQLYALESWGKGYGIGGMHYDHVQAACRRIVPEYQGSPIDTTSSSGFHYAYDLLDDVVTHERSYDLVRMVQACDERLRNAGVQEGYASARNFPGGDDASGVGAVAPAQQRKATDAEIQEWADRHDLGSSSITDLRCIFEDAESAHLTRGVGVAPHETFSRETPMPSDKTPGG